MRVSVHLHADLARLAPDDARQGRVVFDLPTGAVVGDVLARLEVPRHRRVVIGLNGEAAALTAALNDGDRIDLVAPMSGG